MTVYCRSSRSTVRIGAGDIAHDAKLLRVLTDRGSEYCGNPERHEYELYLAVEDIDHSRAKTKRPCALPPPQRTALSRADALIAANEILKRDRGKHVIEVFCMFVAPHRTTLMRWLCQSLG
jgi:hypothetical protein